MCTIFQRAIIAAPLALLAACSGFTDSDRALLTQANQNAVAARASADRAADVAQQAAQTAQRAEQDAQAAAEKADRIYQRNLRK
jgi:hypothetical protein